MKFMSVKMANLRKYCPIFVFTLLFLVILVLLIVFLVEMHSSSLIVLLCCVLSLLVTCLVLLLFIIFNRTKITACTRCVWVIIWIFLFIGSLQIIVHLSLSFNRPKSEAHYLYDKTAKILAYCIISLLTLCTIGMIVPLCTASCNSDADEILQGNTVPMGDFGSLNYGFTGDSSGGGDCGGGDGGGDGGGCGGGGDGGD